MNLKSQKVKKYWGDLHQHIDYSNIDQAIIKEFKGFHPKLIKSWLPKEEGIYMANEKYILSRKEKKHRLMIKLEKLFGLELSKKHFKLLR